MGIFGGGGQKDPSKDAMNTLQQIPGTVTPYYQPYIDMGQQAGNQLGKQYMGMATDPNDWYNNIMSGYTQSPQYEYNQKQLTGQQQAAANAGGFAGTSYDQGVQAQTTAGLQAQDENQYFNNVYGIQRAGQQGGQHFFDTGYDASTHLADLLAGNLAAEAGLQYKSAAFQDQTRANRNANIMGAGGTAIGGAFGKWG